MEIERPLLARKEFHERLSVTRGSEFNDSFVFKGPNLGLAFFSTLSQQYRGSQTTDLPAEIS